MPPANPGHVLSRGLIRARMWASAGWLAEAAGDRLDGIERSALVHVLHVGAGVDRQIADLAQRFGATPELLEETPFVLIGSVEQLVDELDRLRLELGITHYVVRDAESFPPVVAALAGC